MLKLGFTTKKNLSKAKDSYKYNVELLISFVSLVFCLLLFVSSFTLKTTANSSLQSKLKHYNSINPLVTNSCTVDFHKSMFTTDLGPASLAVGDIDGDGKADLVTSNQNTNTISVLRNTSTPGTVSFAPKVDVVAGNNNISVAIGDLDGDGKLDIVVANSSSSVAVLLNTSTSGNISFATSVNIAVAGIFGTVTIGDIDGDGKADIAEAIFRNNTLSILRNTITTVGTVSFARTDLATAQSPNSVKISDIDADGKPELIVANANNTPNNTVSVFRNTGTAGTISFAPRVDFTTDILPLDLVSNDLDGDGKPDIAALCGVGIVSLLRNTSTSGIISFASKVSVSTAPNTSPNVISVGDLDGDGKLDLVESNLQDASITILINNSSPGNFSFATKNFSSGGNIPIGIVINDIDGDNKADISVTNRSSNIVAVLQNSQMSLSPSTISSASVGVAYNQTFTTTGGQSPYSFSISGSLPTGITFSSTTGTLQGTTTQAGSFPITVTTTDANSCSSSQNYTLVVNSGPATTLMVTASTSNLVSGQAFNITVTALDVANNTATSYTGTIAFTSSDPSATLPSNYTFTSADAGVKTFTNGVTLRTPATQIITATDTLQSSITGNTTITVSKANTTTMLSSSLSSPVFGQSITFTATVGVNSPGTGTPTETVTFFDGGSQIGTPQTLSNGSASISTSSLSTGTHSITAVYSSGTRFNSSTSLALSQMVNKANTTTSIMSTVNSSAFGQTVTFTATISANSPGSGTPTGTLQFKDGTNNLGTPVNLINRTATLSTNSLSAGTHSITAVYNSDSNFNSSISGILNFTVTPPVLNHSTLYVADALNNRIQRSTNNGQSWQTVGFGPGTGLGQFNAPKGVTVDSSDSIIFVADTANNRVQRSTDSGATWNAIATAGLATNQVNQPAAVAYDEPTNKLYIADTANNRILVVTNASTTSPTFAIFAGATAGNTLGKFNQPQSVAVNSNGMVYVADTLNNRIQMNSTGLDTGWTILATTGSAIGQVNAPKGMYVDDSGNIWVADTINNRIQVNTNGTWSVFMNAGTAVGTVNHPEGIVVNITGNVFVADTGNNRIQCKPAKGGAATVVGAPGLNIGQFNQPSGIR